jgi:hypothetical protein
MNAVQEFFRTVADSRSVAAASTSIVAMARRQWLDDNA